MLGEPEYIIAERNALKKKIEIMRRAERAIKRDSSLAAAFAE